MICVNMPHCLSSKLYCVGFSTPGNSPHVWPIFCLFLVPIWIKTFSFVTLVKQAKFEMAFKNLSAKVYFSNFDHDV